MDEKYAFSAEAIANLLEGLKSWSWAQKQTIETELPQEDAVNLPQLSLRETTKAIKEINKDLGILAKRRQLTNGISPGKLGGVLAYRLARHRLLHFDRESVDCKGIEGYQEEVVLNLVLDALQIDWGADWIREQLGTTCDTGSPWGRRWHIDLVKEVSYLLRKRHCNQETLAIVFDALAFLDTAVQTIQSQKSEIAELKAQIEALQIQPNQH